MRIDYLLAAYRSLERASNRAMGDNERQQVEAAVADIQLLGSAGQVKLAAEFAKRIAAEGTAGTEPLLQDLRSSLRRELLLEPVPPIRVWFRMSRDGGAAWDRSELWRGTDQAPRRAIRDELAGEPLTPDFSEAFPAEMADLARTSGPNAAIEASLDRIAESLRSIVGRTGEQVTGLGASQLANRALALGLIDPDLAEAINGLGIMRSLADRDRERVTLEHAADFVTFASGALFALSRARRGRPGSAT